MKKVLVEIVKNPDTGGVAFECLCGPGHTIGDIMREDDGRWVQTYGGRVIQIFAADEIKERTVLNGLEKAIKKCSK